MTTSTPVLDIILEGFLIKPLPTFSAPVQNMLLHLSQATVSDSDLVSFVLSDPILTHKVLKLANSRMFNAFGRKICTVTKAIKIIGVEVLYNMVSSCLVYEESIKHKNPGHQFLKAEMVKSATCGALSAEFHNLGKVPTADASEELKIAGFLSKFGAICVAYYLPDKWEVICAAISEGADPAVAATMEIGMSFEALGCALCEKEGIPYTALTAFLETVEASSVVASAVGCTDILFNPNIDKDAELEAFAESLGISATQLKSVTDQVKDSMVAALGADAVSVDEPRYPSSTEGLLNKGLVETKIGMSGMTLTGVIAATLGVMFDAMNATRAAVFLYNAKEKNFKCILSKNISNNSSKYLNFSSTSVGDAFCLAGKSGLISKIENCADKGSIKMPIWWHTHLGDAHQAMIIPLMWNGGCVAYMYLDWTRPKVMPSITPDVFAILENLRELAYVKLRATAEAAAAKSSLRR